METLPEPCQRFQIYNIVIPSYYQYILQIILNSDYNTNDDGDDDDIQAIITQ